MNQEQPQSTTTAPTPEAVTKYLSGDGTRCPFCGSEDIEGGSFNCEGRTAWQNISCPKCNNEWQDVYQLAFIADPHSADEFESARWLEYTLRSITCYRIDGRECEIHIAPRPPYCDRGNFVATISTSGELALGFDGQDGWPRYYFGLDRAKREIEAWLTKRGQMKQAEANGT